MTDKQIIIDGVDVSGCQHFCKDEPCKNTCQYFCTPCEWVGIQNCMYKYGKRKKQEYEELKKYIKHLHNLCGNETDKQYKYKRILAEIKNIVETCNSGIFCSECPYTEQCRTDIEAEALGICKLILQKCEVEDEI